MKPSKPVKQAEVSYRPCIEQVPLEYFMGFTYKASQMSCNYQKWNEKEEKMNMNDYNYNAWNKNYPQNEYYPTMYNSYTNYKELPKYHKNQKFNAANSFDGSSYNQYYNRSDAQPPIKRGFTKTKKKKFHYNNFNYMPTNWNENIWAYPPKSYQKQMYLFETYIEINKKKEPWFTSHPDKGNSTSGQSFQNKQIPITPKLMVDVQKNKSQTSIEKYENTQIKEEKINKAKPEKQASETRMRSNSDLEFKSPSINSNQANANQNKNGSNEKNASNSSKGASSNSNTNNKIGAVPEQLLNIEPGLPFATSSSIPFTSFEQISSKAALEAIKNKPSGSLYFKKVNWRKIFR